MGPDSNTANRAIVVPACRQPEAKTRPHENKIESVVPTTSRSAIQYTTMSRAAAALTPNSASTHLVPVILASAAGAEANKGLRVSGERVVVDRQIQIFPADSTAVAWPCGHP